MSRQQRMRGFVTPAMRHGWRRAYHTNEERYLWREKRLGMAMDNLSAASPLDRL